MDSETTLNSYDDNKYFRVQINSIDSYQTIPSILDQPKLKIATYDRTSVIRVFGQTPSGHTVCVHVHGVLPYFYVQLQNTSFHDAFTNLDEVNKLAATLHAQLEELMKSSFKRKRLNEEDLAHVEGVTFNKFDHKISAGIKKDTNLKYIASVQPCKGVPFYGYHVGYSVFFKISYLGPVYKNRLMSVLESHEMPFCFDIYESHVSLQLQFLADFNLYGCAWLKLKKCFFRYPVFNTSDEFYQMKLNDEIIDYTNRFITNKNVFKNTKIVRKGLENPNFSRISNTFLEIDTTAGWIANRDSIQIQNLHHNFVEKLKSTNVGKDFKYITSTRELWKDARFQRKLRKVSPYKPPDPFLRTVSADSIKWSDQPEMDEIYKYCVLSSRTKLPSDFPESRLRFSSFVNEAGFMLVIPTAFELMENSFLSINYEDIQKARDSEATGVPEDHFPETGNENLDGEYVEPDYEVDGDINQDGDILSNDNSHTNLNDKESGFSDRTEGELANVPKNPLGGNNGSEALETVSIKKKRHYDKINENVKDNVSFDDLSFNFREPLRPSQKRKKLSLNFLSAPQKKRKALLRLFKISKRNKLYAYSISPPHVADIKNTINNFTVPQYEYFDPFYGKEQDVPETPFIRNNKRFKIESRELKSLKSITFKGMGISGQICRHNKKYFELSITKINDKIILGRICPSKSKVYKYTAPKPSYNDILNSPGPFSAGQVGNSALNVNSTGYKRTVYSSQIEYLTPKASKRHNSSSPIKKAKRRPDGYNNLSLLTVETHINFRPNCAADPSKDSVGAIFWKIDTNSISLDLDIVDQGILIYLPEDNEEGPERIIKQFASLTEVAIEIFSDELTMFKELVSLVNLFDPDILAAYEIHGSSWGYIIDRCQARYKYDIAKYLARVSAYLNNKALDFYGFTHASSMVITGRHMVNIWRLVRQEVALTSYTMENVVYNVLRHRIPHFSANKLSEIFNGARKPGKLSVLLNYYINRVNYNIRLLESLDIIFKTVEQARLGGIDFYSVFYRGSQYKVESFLLRLAKAQHFMLLSPTKKQVRKQKALECIPLVMEPASGFYKSPLVVLDFQSLYPSIIIAYNYCYSTCLGRIRGFDADKKRRLGVTSFRHPPGLLNLLAKDIFLSPNGLMFVKQSVRKSMLAKMLEEILDTRFMIKATMKSFKTDLNPNSRQNDNGINRLYDSRQLALKLIANVTYGYTSATFSGRMPCSDIADAIVQTGRETLERSINHIESVKEWNAKVVYGDTDSLFVYFPGRSKDDAFKLGREIAKKITEQNPDPITLKFEKVYHPSVLMAKKRYVGYSYESEDQTEPKFDAKGIETVRRDGIPAQQKIMEKSLRLLFETADISKVKAYVKDQFYKIMKNKVSIQDFCFAKEVKIGAYKSEKTMPPGALLVTKKMNQDTGYEPQYKERIPYVIMKAGANDMLRDKAILLEDIIHKPNFKLDSEYYIIKMLIPPLERIFNLVGVDVKEWYYEMPRYFHYDELKFAKNAPDSRTAFNSNPGAMLKSKNFPAKNNSNLLQVYLQVDKCLNCDKPVQKTEGIDMAGFPFGQNKLNNVLRNKFCEDCAKNEEESLFQIINRFKASQDKAIKYYTICRDCSVNKLNGNDVLEIWCNSGDCPVYYSRVKATAKVQVYLRIAAEVGL